MRIQLLSDLHLESETYTPLPAPGAELTVLAGDIDAGWRGLAAFDDWPCPLVMVAGNHEFDGRELTTALPALRIQAQRFGITLLERESLIVEGGDGRRVRLLGCVRWSDFDLFGSEQRARCMRAATYFQNIMGATIDGRPFDAEEVRLLGLAAGQWLAAQLRASADGRWDATCVITHFAPSLRSHDPRYGSQPTTASFCNADDDLLPLADTWLHGHVHVRCEYQVGSCAVFANPRGLGKKQEPLGWQPERLFAI